MGIEGSEAPCWTGACCRKSGSSFVSLEVCSMCLNRALCSSGGMGGWHLGSAGSGGTEKTLRLNLLLPFLALCCWCAWVSLERCCCPSSGSATLTCSVFVTSPAGQGTCRKGPSLLPVLGGRRAWLAPSRGVVKVLCPPVHPTARAVIPPEHLERSSPRCCIVLKTLQMSLLHLQ